ncbi:Acylphosphatase [uncultured archaeon]|nr:Acylphosphatase [uncultured archaeon]
MRFVEIRLTGRVQGVGCRMWITAQARTLGLGGWVRNDDDGSVRARLEGDGEKIKALLGALSALHDPLGVDVKKLEVVQEGDAPGEPQPFSLAF